MKSKASRPRRPTRLAAAAAVTVLSWTTPAWPAAGDGAPVHASAAASASDAAKAPAKKKSSVVPSSQQIDINGASRERLKTLPGIGDAEAAKVIAGRPYYSKTDLVTRGILPEGAYAAIKYRIFAAPPAAKPNSKK